MKRYGKEFPLDDPAVLDGDGGFIGVMRRESIELLPPGYVWAGENADFEDGGMRARRGFVTPVWGRVGSALIGVGGFRDPNTRAEWTLQAGASGVAMSRPGEAPIIVGVPETTTGEAVFCQAFDKVLMFRTDADGEAVAPWQWNGIGAFEPVPREDMSDGTQPIPYSAGGVGLSDRIFVWGAGDDGGDYGWLSDIGSYSRFPLTARLRFNAGLDDRIVSAFPFNKSAVIVFKNRSIFRLSGVSGDLSGMVNERVTTRFGLLAPQSVASDGTDVLFLSAEGVYRVGEVWEDRVQAPPVAVSWDIKRLLAERVNWQAASRAAAAVWDDKYFLALPVDGATANNALFIYDLPTKAWRGPHTFAEGAQFDRLLVRSWLGRDRLFACDFASGQLYLMCEGEEDCIGDEEPAAIAFDWTLRGYRGGDQGRKRWRQIRLATEERQASYTVSILTDGVSEATELAPAPMTRSRTMNLDGTTWDATNAGNDHGASGREDYGVILTPPLVLGASGIVLDRNQAFAEPFHAGGERGRVAQVKITGSARGAFVLRSVQIEGSAIDRANTTTA